MRWTAEADYPQELALSRGGDCLRLLGLGQLVFGCPREGHARLGEEPARGLDGDLLTWYSLRRMDDAGSRRGRHRVTDMDFGNGGVRVVQA